MWICIYIHTYTGTRICTMYIRGFYPTLITVVVLCMYLFTYIYLYMEHIRIEWLCPCFSPTIWISLQHRNVLNHYWASESSNISTVTVISVRYKSSDIPFLLTVYLMCYVAFPVGSAMASFEGTVPQIFRVGHSFLIKNKLKYSPFGHIHNDHCFSGPGSPPVKKKKTDESFLSPGTYLGLQSLWYMSYVTWFHLFCFTSNIISVSSYFFLRNIVFSSFFCVECDSVNWGSNPLDWMGGQQLLPVRRCSTPPLDLRVWINVRRFVIIAHSEGQCRVIAELHVCNTWHDE